MNWIREVKKNYLKRIKMHVQVLIQPVLQGGCRQCKLGLFNSPVFRVISSSYSPLKILAAPLSTSTSVWPGVALPSCRNAKSKHKSLLSSDRPDSASLSATANVHFEAHAFSDQTMKVGLRSECSRLLKRSLMVDRTDKDGWRVIRMAFKTLPNKRAQFSACLTKADNGPSDRQIFL